MLNFKAKYTLLDNNIKDISKKDRIKNIIIIVLTTLLLTHITISVIIINNLSQYESKNINEKENVEIFNNNDDDNKVFELKDFMLVNLNETNGPITVDRKKDDGTKLNLYSMMINSRNNDILDSLNSKKFDELEKDLPQKDEYFCELDMKIPPEGYRGYNVTCPVHYSIIIDKAFYGRYAQDTKNCNLYDDGSEVRYINRYTSNDCGYDTIEDIKELCEGKVDCIIKPTNYFFTNKCKSLFKYLHVKYHCTKDTVSKNFFIHIFISNCNKVEVIIIKLEALKI